MTLAGRDRLELGVALGCHTRVHACQRGGGGARFDRACAAASQRGQWGSLDVVTAAHLPACPPPSLQ